ncbi:MAG: methylmalonyl Co-A mutase-associated GTPase MeaB [Candidatus Methylacidiphilales bacterium]|nr:methylmalonyl Co-A mutase-associated GTPase MeaB [Candidatus Methylacidiphilales bacterium]
MFPAQQLAEGILAGNRTLLARAITLVESNAPKHEAPARELVARLLPHTGRAKRIGISGVPGVGKSTFIETLGLHLTRSGKKIAVLAVDPSSTRTGGSILGDKTRMEQLSVDPNAFIRPSPSGGTLGGVTRKTRETLLLCEAFGFDPVLIETVGTGQSETTVRSMTDFFLLLLAPHTGDELQGIKKGIVEMADAVVVNKADGESRHAAERTQAEYHSALHYLHSATPGWKPPCLLASALQNEGIADFWKTVETFYQLLEPRGVLRTRREQQSVEWMLAQVREQLELDFQRHPSVQPLLSKLGEQVRSGLVTPTEAAQQLLRAYRTTPI